MEFDWLSWGLLFLVVALLLYGYISSLKNKTESVKSAALSGWGTIFQGTAALLLVVVGAFKGDEIIQSINELKIQMESIKSDTKAIRELVPVPNFRKLEDKSTSEKEKYWSELLKNIPSKRSVDTGFYIENKQQYINKLMGVSSFEEYNKIMQEMAKSAKITRTFKGSKNAPVVEFIYSPNDPNNNAVIMYEKEGSETEQDK